MNPTLHEESLLCLVLPLPFHISRTTWRFPYAVYENSIDDFTCGTSIKKLYLLQAAYTYNNNIITNIKATCLNGSKQSRKGKGGRWNQQEKIRAHSARSQRMIGRRPQCEPATGSPDAMAMAMAMAMATSGSATTSGSASVSASTATKATTTGTCSRL